MKIPIPFSMLVAGSLRSRGIPFAGHVPWAVRATDAAEAGQRTIEHLTGSALGCSSAEDRLDAEYLAWQAAQAAGDSSVSLLEYSRREWPVVLATREDLDGLLGEAETLASQETAAPEPD